MKTIKNLAFPAFVGLLLLASSVPAAQAQVQGQMYIAITDNVYSNSSVTLPVGTTVTWTNTGNNSHTVTADNGSFDSGTIAPNQTFVRTFNAQGIFAYHDRFYGASGGIGMSATIVIGNGTGGNPTCMPVTQNVNVNGLAQLSASGGNGSYSWSAPNGSPSFGSGSYFTTSYLLSGVQTVTVTSNGLSGQCIVNIQQNGGGIVGGAPVCSPFTQSANMGDFVSFSATGGNGNYVWSSPSLTITNPTGSSFSARFATAGTQTVTVSSNGQSSQCLVNVGGQVLGASTIVTGPEDATLWAIVIGLLGAILAYGAIFPRYPRKLWRAVAGR